MANPSTRGCSGQIRDDDQGFVKMHCPLKDGCYRYIMSNKRSPDKQWAAMGQAPYDPDTAKCDEYWRK